VTVKFVALNTV